MTPIILLVCLPGISAIGELSRETHKTAGATQQKNELSCFVCDSLDDATCFNLTTIQQSIKKDLLKKCKNDQRVCKVKKYSYTIGTENSTSLMRIWSMQRECTQKCEAGCIVIGERTKLYSCTTCCTKTGCNDGSAGFRPVSDTPITLMLSSVACLLSRRL